MLKAIIVSCLITGIIVFASVFLITVMIEVIRKERNERTT